MLVIWVWLAFAPGRKEKYMNRGLMLSITLCLILSSRTAIAGSTTLVSGKSQRNQSNGASSKPSASDNGQFIAFRSPATNLAAARCNNGFNHIFVRARSAGTITCVSVNSNDNQAVQDSDAPSISSNGQFVAFDSAATNLAGGTCNNGFSQIFVRDRSAGTTRCVSVNSNGNQGNQNSHAPSISSNGQFVAFDSVSTNLTGGKCNSGFHRIFVHDRTTGTTICVSVHSNGTEGNGDSFDPSISANGQMVAFHSSATNLTNRCTNGNSHVYVHDLTTGQTRCVSLDSNENQSDGNSDLPKISGDGLFVAFESDATNLTSQCNNAFAHIFVRDLTNGRTSCASVDNNDNQGNNDSVQPSISSDGRLVTFSSVATNLTITRCIAGNSQVFVRDRTGKKTTCASVDAKKREGNGASVNPAISDDSRLVAFESNSNNLVKNDTNGLLDVFVHVLP
jgi:hypothetical protein